MVMQPDIAAPGSDILAAWSPASSNQPGDYMIISGTSMACPHISGIVALLKVEHPDWSPAAIKSALVTTGNNIIGANRNPFKIFEKEIGHEWTGFALKPNHKTYLSPEATAANGRVGLAWLVFWTGWWVE